MLEPVYPVNDPLEMKAILASTIVWDELLKDVFAKTVSGIDCVLKTDDRYQSVFSYTIQKGVAIARYVGQPYIIYILLVYIVLESG